MQLLHSSDFISGFLALSRSTNPEGGRRDGSAGKLNLARIAGEHWLYGLSGDFTSKGYNINDVGFFFRPNDVGSVASVTYKEDVPAQVVRSYSVSLNAHIRHNFDGFNRI